MSIWGSLIGGMIGLSLGGPFGMLLGSIIGSKVSRSRTRGYKSFTNPQQVFALSLIVLSAKEELIAVKDKLRIPDNEIDQVGKIFNKAKEESSGYEPYAIQISEIYKGNLNVLEEVINVLFYIAEADGVVSPKELGMIEHIAQIFNINQTQFQAIKESRKASDKLNPYIVLESKPDDDISTIRKKYLILSKQHHPDLLMNKGVPKEVIEESKNKMRAINNAWNQIQKLKKN